MALESLIQVLKVVRFLELSGLTERLVWGCQIEKLKVSNVPQAVDQSRTLGDTNGRQSGIAVAEGRRPKAIVGYRLPNAIATACIAATALGQTLRLVNESMQMK